MTVYLDHAATTPILDVARGAMMDALGLLNASSAHREGRAARARAEQARESIAEHVGVAARDVIFTSGGTEADNLALKGIYWSRSARRNRPRRVLVSPVEHHAVLDPADWLEEKQDAAVVRLSVDAQGRVDPAQVADELSEHPGEVALVAVMWANNEVGTVQPIAELAAICAESGVPLHVDAVQALGHIPLDATLATTMAVSAHKLGGPKGMGALIMGRRAGLVPLAHGGGQERHLRSGTVDVPAIAGFAAAVEHMVPDVVASAERLAKLRDEMVREVRRIDPSVIVNGPEGGSDVRLPGNAHFSFPGCVGDNLLMLLDAEDVCISTGSACTSGVTEPSHVLTAMKVEPEIAQSSLRVTLGHTTTSADVTAFLAALPLALDRARAAGAAAGG